MFSISLSHSSSTENQCIAGTSHAAAIHLLLLCAFLFICSIASAQTNTGIVSAISCSAASIAGAGTDSCKVTLKYAASKPGPLTLTLASSNAAVTVPATLSIAGGASSGTFSAKVAAVSTAQTATLSAKAWNSPVTFAISLTPAQSSPASPSLKVNATSIAFGNVLVSDSATQSLTLAASGGAVVVNSATVTGAGFSASGLSFPLSLASGQAATLNVVFAPTSAATASGQLSIASNAGNSTVSLSGTGTTAKVNLAWNASASVSGYYVYRAPSGSTSYQKLNASLDSATSYTDTTVAIGQTYEYYVVSVNSAGALSAPSNTTTVAVP